MGTLMTWILAQACRPGRAARRSACRGRRPARRVAPAGPAASVAVPGGSAGSARHGAPGLVTVSPRLPLSTIAAVSPGPKDAELSAAPFSRSGGDRIQWLPPSEDQAASRLAAGPVPAASSAIMPLAVLVSLSTWTGWLARAAGSAGPAACQVPPVPAKMPAVPGWPQLPPSSGMPGRGERGGGEVLQPAAAAGRGRGEGPLRGQGGPAGVAGCGQLGGAVGEQGEQGAGAGGGGQRVGDVGQGPVERAGR